MLESHAKSKNRKTEKQKYLNFVVLLWGRVADADAYAVVFNEGGEGRRERRGRDVDEKVRTVMCVCVCV